MCDQPATHYHGSGFQISQLASERLRVIMSEGHYVGWNYLGSWSRLSLAII
jgi:hypothetical protein